jgi:hypothetical protein
MRVLIACEESGRVRDEFAKLGHYAMSCDLLPSRTKGLHYQGNVLDILDKGWDLMIAFPPCTHLASSGARHFHKKKKVQAEALVFVKKLMNAPVPMICIENPVGVISTKIRKPDQIVQPYFFGDKAQKTTCLWLKGLPLLTYSAKTTVDKGEFFEWTDGKTGAKKRQPLWYYECFKNGDGESRSKCRSTTFKGIAKAMATQWGKVKPPESKLPLKVKIATKPIKKTLKTARK